jgi:N-acetyl-anhydromuramyl-L-alanine amidase AmpD
MTAWVLLAAPPPAPSAELPARVRRIVLHTPGGPFYGRPEMRFVFLSPPETQALWKNPTFGAHWIVWTDGSLWPRHPRAGEAASARPPVERAADEAWKQRLAYEAAPVYSHTEGRNRDSVGIEVAHSGHSTDGFPPEQMRSLAWLLRTLLGMSQGRLGPSEVVGHKDLDRRPAYVSGSCEESGCPTYVDEQGQPFRRRVDPPEALFDALRAFGFDIPRAGVEGDTHLLRAEAVPPGTRPRVAGQ